MHPSVALRSPSVPSTSTLHVPDVVRGVMLLAGLPILAKFTLLNEHMIMGPVSWVVFLGYAGVALAAAARIVMVDAQAPRSPSVRVERTRKLGLFKELAIAGTGSLFLLGPIGYLMATTSQEMWGGRVQEASGADPIGFVFASFFGLMGFFMIFWRPQFALDAAARKVVRYAFGRSIPLGVKELPYADLAVYTDGYFITNTGHRLGDMIRGRVGKYTFELEMIPNNFAQELVQHRAMGWASALGVRYMTPEQAGVAELNA